MLGVPVLILAGVGYLVLTGGRAESTDDAYVQAAKAPISASIAGRVIEVDVTENQNVRAGQVLFRLDPADELNALRRAEAALAAARLQVVTLRSTLDQQKLLMGSAQRTRDYAETEARRQEALVEAGVSSRQQASDARHAADLAEAQAAVARQQAAAALANLGAAARESDKYPAVLQAEAAVDAARLNLAYTVVAAPSDGVVTRVDQLQKGAYLNPAQTVFFLLSGEPWVEANFKEDQLAHMRVGQPARISIDALGGRILPGHVASFSPGAGSSFSPLPAQNATGNWVKVVQRLPVRIAFDKAPPEVVSRAGLSARITVDVRGPGRAGGGS
jgi:membrane fusion protein (multidrug efflux system)